MKRFSSILLLIFLLAGSGFCSEKNNKIALAAYADGKGSVALFWIPGTVWPEGGWRVEKIQNGKTTVLKKSILPGEDKNHLQRLPVEDQKTVQAFSKKQRKGKLTKDERKMAVFVLGLKAAIDLNFGYGIGLRFMDNTKEKGERKYVIKALGKNAKVLDQTVSNIVDPFKKPTPVPPVTLLETEVTLDGVELRWSKPAFGKDNPVIGYRIERTDPDGSVVSLSEKTLIVSHEVFTKKNTIFIDEKAPTEVRVIYRIYGIGLFAQRSEAFKITIYIEDKAALIPPKQLRAKNGNEKVILSWNRGESMHCAGYVIERSYLQKGPYQTLTPEGLQLDKTSYTDKDVTAGSSYFYRIHSINKKGKVGHASDPVKAQPTTKIKPPKVKKLKAEVGKTIVALTWGMPIKAVSGFMVYRKPKGSETWSQLNNYAVRGNRYDDHFGLQTYGAFSYKVTAVGFDNIEGLASDIVKIELIDSISPNAPYITDISSKNGKINLLFKAAAPAEDTDHFYLIRSIDENDPGLVLGGKILTNTNSYTDTFIKYGQRYWYRMVAVDKAGNRSDLSQPVAIVAQNPPIPTPKSPKVQFRAKPFAHVAISIGKVPERLTVHIQRRVKGEKMFATIATGIIAKKTIDTQPPFGTDVEYRLIYEAENAVVGNASGATAITIPEAEGR